MLKLDSTINLKHFEICLLDSLCCPFQFRYFFPLCIKYKFSVLRKNYLDTLILLFWFKVLLIAASYYHNRTMQSIGSIQDRLKPRAYQVLDVDIRNKYGKNTSN